MARAREDMPLYVLTNTRGFYGAAAILYEGLLEQCVRKFPGDVFVIPSSVHELLLVSAEDVWSAQDMTEMSRCSQSNRGGARKKFCLIMCILPEKSG